MTPSGRGFLAGYAAERFFNSIDEISRKVFPGAEDAPASVALPEAAPSALAAVPARSTG
jgi:hypothetical protein